MASHNPIQDTTALASAKSRRLLVSPITTLLKSLEDTDNISLHDVIQAYSTFHQRLRLISPFIEDHDTCSHVFEEFQKHAPQIARCLQRDIQYALHDPFPDTPELRDGHIPDSMASTTPDLSDEDMKYAKDASCVSQHALLLCSTIFYFPRLCGYFEDKTLIEIMDGILVLLKEPLLPTPHAKRTYSIALLILSSNFLPQKVVVAIKRNAVPLVRKIVAGDLPHLCSDANLGDALRALRDLLPLDGNISFTTATMLRPVCSHLLSGQPMVRRAAALTLGGFAYGQLTTQLGSFSESWMMAGDLVRDFIIHETPRKHPDGASDRRLYDIAVQIMSEDDSLEMCWLLTTLASLMVLSQGAIISIPSFVRLASTVANVARRHPRHAVRTLHLCFWRCFVWSLLAFPQYASQALQNGKMQIADWKSKWFLAIGFTKQELGGGIGTALVYCLLGMKPIRDDGAGNNPDLLYSAPWLAVLKDMVDSPLPEIHREGISVLAHLVSAIGSSAHHDAKLERPLDPWKVLNRQLFDGTTLSPDTLARLVSPSFAVSRIKRLSEKDIEERWDELMSLWEVGLDRVLGVEQLPALSSDMVSIWHALLLVQSELTQRNGHLILPESTTSRAVMIVLRLFIQDTQPARALVRLSAAKQLWDVMKIAFSNEWASDTARQMLESLFQAKYTAISDDEVATAWNLICSELIAVAGSQHLSAVLSPGSRVLADLEIRDIWNTLAKVWDRLPEVPEWDVTVTFLAVATHNWDLTKDEIDLWMSVLSHCIRVASHRGVAANAVIEGVLQHTLADSDSPCLALLPVLLSHTSLAPSDAFPLLLFTYLNDLMLALYPQQEAIYPVLDLFRSFTAMLDTYMTSHLLQFLSVMSEGLSVWISDESLVILDDEFNDIIITFYTSCLKHLQNITHTAETLATIETFLCSAFNHTPAPGFGPIACRAFWDAVSEKFPTSKIDCPERLKMYLLAVGDVTGSSALLFGSEQETLEHKGYEGDAIPESDLGSPSIGDFADLPGDLDLEGFGYTPDGRVGNGRYRRRRHSRHSSSERTSTDERHSPLPPSSDDVPSSSVFNSSQLDRRSSSPWLSRSSDAMDITSSPAVARLLFKRARDDDEEDGPAQRPKSVSRTSSLSSGRVSEEESSERRATKRARSSSPGEQDENEGKAARAISPEVPSPVRYHRTPTRASSLDAFLSPEVPLPQELARRESDSEDDYASWEKALALPEVKSVRKELKIEGRVSEDEESDAANSPTPRRDSSARSISSPTRPKHNAADRSQSAPILKADMMIKPGRRSRTTSNIPRAASEKIETLRAACAALQDDESDVPLGDLLDAQRLLQETNLRLNDRLRRKV